MDGINWFQVLAYIFEFLSDPSTHFLLACLAGALGYLLTSITSYALLRVMGYGTGKPITTGVAYGIIFLSLLVAVSCAFLSHYCLDYFVVLINTPLDPPLELDIPEHLKQLFL